MMMVSSTMPQLHHGTKDSMMPLSSSALSRMRADSPELDEDNERGDRNASPAPRIYPGGSTFDLAMFLRETEPPPKAPEKVPARSGSVKSSPLSNFFRSGRHATKSSEESRPSQAQPPHSLVAKTAVNGKKYMQITIPSSVQDDIHLHKSDYQRPLGSFPLDAPRKTHDLSTVGPRVEQDLAQPAHPGPISDVPSRKPISDLHARRIKDAPRLTLPGHAPEAASHRHTPDRKQTVDDSQAARASHVSRKPSKILHATGDVGAQPDVGQEAGLKEHDRLLATVPTTPEKANNNSDVEDVQASATTFGPMHNEPSMASPTQSNAAGLDAKSIPETPTRLTSKDEERLFVSRRGSRVPASSIDPASPARSTNGDVGSQPKQRKRSPKDSRRGFTARPPQPGPAPTKALPSLPEFHDDVAGPRPSLDWAEGHHSALRNGRRSVSPANRDQKAFKAPAANLDNIAKTVVAPESPQSSDGNEVAGATRRPQSQCPAAGAQSESAGSETGWKPCKEDFGVHQDQVVPKQFVVPPRASSDPRRASRVSGTTSNRSSKRSSTSAEKARQQNRFSRLWIVDDEEPMPGAQRSSEPHSGRRIEQHSLGERSSSLEADCGHAPGLVLPSSDDEYGAKGPWRKSSSKTSKRSTSGGPSSTRSSRTMTSQSQMEIEARLGALERRNALLEAALVALLRSPAAAPNPEGAASQPLTELRDSVENERPSSRRPSSLEVLISTIAAQDHHASFGSSG